MAVPRVEASPWAVGRRRALTLLERHAFVAQQLTLYLALVEAWESAWAAARAEQVRPEALAGWAARRALPMVLAATAQAGPEPLVRSLLPVNDLGAAGDLMAAWLAGDELVPVERYLARASLRGPLEALDAGAACAGDPSPRGERRCPRCGGPPQLSFRTDTGDQLVSGHRRLQCARCGASWSFSSSACAYCGETAGGRRTVHAERRAGPRVGRGSLEPGEPGASPPAATTAPDASGTPARHAPGTTARHASGTTAPDASGTPAPADATFPHVRIEACASCQRYLIDVDLGLDPGSVPEVDELAALPLDLYAAERGLSKITPNVMGF
jgi:FdhE protein